MFDVVWCNPPFNASEAEAMKVTDRKWRQLGKSELKQTLNFGGQHAELICEGGEEGFISRMIMESTKYKQQVLWFTALVSREASLRKLRSVMRKARPVEFAEIPMQIGNKKSRILIWTWFDQVDRQNWAKHYWKL
jgi:23S rRNA (adenine1618-N6)-methyltransferase